MARITSTLNLLGGNNDLSRLAVAHSRHGVVQQANRAHDLACLLHHIVREVGRITHGELARGSLTVRHHSLDMALVVKQQLIGSAVQHEHASLDSAEAGETLGEAAQTVHGVDVGRGTVLVERVAVQLHGLHRLHGRLVQVVVVQTKGHGVAGELLAVLVQTVLLEQLAHGHVHERNVGVSGNTVLSGNIHRKDIGKETAVLQFLHHGQQRGAQSLRGSSRHLTIRRKRWEAEE